MQRQRGSIEDSLPARRLFEFHGGRRDDFLDSQPHHLHGMSTALLMETSSACNHRRSLAVKVGALPPRRLLIKG